MPAMHGADEYEWAGTEFLIFLPAIRVHSCDSWQMLRYRAAVASFVSRAGQKLDRAMSDFAIDATGLVCADLGCNAGGFTDCLLQRGAAKVFAVDTGYGMFDYRLRKDPRVVVMERTNAMHVLLPEAIDLIVIDVAWTKQSHILPAAKRMLKAGGSVVTLVKPHYEADPAWLRGGVLDRSRLDEVLAGVKRDSEAIGFMQRGIVESPILGAKGNVEYLAWLKRLEGVTP
jgi:23S rRNA (cytidine1920-2'-O)/16S rRNA (cytidine1409-2'-O)-methyltransferase